jgi:hypothetical protein
LNDKPWLHDDFPDFETENSTKTCKKGLVFSRFFIEKIGILQGATI